MKTRDTYYGKKEIVMNATKIKSIFDKVANFLIIALVMVGTVAFGAASEVGEGGQLLSKLFLVFIGAIITLQIIPGLILLGAMLKGLMGLGRKEETTKR